MSDRDKRTNWDTYYGKTFKVTSYTRKTTEKLLLNLLRTHGGDLNKKSILELGGANSCFYDAIMTRIKPGHFHVIDNNELGLELFRQKTVNDKNVSFENADVLHMKPSKKYDIVFSIGLIEHFDKENTARAIKTHFENVNENGLVIISFPTPTFLYRLARKISEIIGIWFFYDERPLKFEEVLPEVTKYGQLLFKTINWKVILTQGFVVVKKNGDAKNESL